MTVAPMGAAAGQTLNVPPRTGTWLQLGAEADTDGEGAGEVAGDEGGGGVMADWAGAAGDERAAVRAAVRVAVPAGAGPSDPDVAGPQPASANVAARTGSASFFMVGFVSLFMGPRLRRPAHDGRTASSQFALSRRQRQGQPERRSGVHFAPYADATA